MAELHQGADTVFTDGKRHSAEGPQRRQAHDHVDDAENHPREAVDHVVDQLPFVAQTMQGEAEQYREQQHLKNVAAGERADHAAGDDVQQERNDALLLCLLGVDRHRLGVQRAGIDVHAGARLHQVDDHQTDNQRDGADDFKIQQRDGAGAPHRLHAFHAGDAGHHGAEDHRCDDHLDQFDEAIAQRFHLGAEVRVEMAKQDTQRDRRQYLKIEALKDRCFHMNILWGEDTHQAAV